MTIIAGGNPISNPLHLSGQSGLPYSDKFVGMEVSHRIAFSGYLSGSILYGSLTWTGWTCGSAYSRPRPTIGALVTHPSLPQGATITAMQLNPGTSNPYGPPILTLVDFNGNAIATTIGTEAIPQQFIIYNFGYGPWQGSNGGTSLCIPLNRGAALGSSKLRMMLENASAPGKFIPTALGENIAVYSEFGAWFLAADQPGGTITLNPVGDLSPAVTLYVKTKTNNTFALNDKVRLDFFMKQETYFILGTISNLSTSGTLGSGGTQTITLSVYYTSTAFFLSTSNIYRAQMSLVTQTKMSSLYGSTYRTLYSYTTPGTYTLTVPYNKAMFSALIVAGGGAGKGTGGSTITARAGGGGGGGGVIVANCQFVKPGSTMTIVVGAGGAGATGTNTPSAGSNSTVTFYNTFAGATGYFEAVRGFSGTNGCRTGAPAWRTCGGAGASSGSTPSTFKYAGGGGGGGNYSVYFFGYCQGWCCGYAGGAAASSTSPGIGGTGSTMAEFSGGVSGTYGAGGNGGYGLSGTGAAAPANSGKGGGGAGKDYCPCLATTYAGGAGGSGAVYIWV